MTEKTIDIKSSTNEQSNKYTSPWYVYLLRCSDNTLYTGITTDLSRRLHQHNHLKTGAKYTRARRPVELVYFEPEADKSLASKREYQLRKLKKTDKEALVVSFAHTSIDLNPTFSGLLSMKS